jgi:hypothetical protein
MEKEAFFELAKYFIGHFLFHSAIVFGASFFVATYIPHEYLQISIPTNIQGALFFSAISGLAAGLGGAMLAVGSSSDELDPYILFKFIKNILAGRETKIMAVDSYTLSDRCHLKVKKADCRLEYFIGVW